MGLITEEPWLNPRQGYRYFSSSVTYSVSYRWVSEALSPQLRRPRREDDL